LELPKRKHPRLKNYDYSQNGCYFVTVCVKDRKNLLGTIPVGRDAHINVIKLRNRKCYKKGAEYEENVPALFFCNICRKKG